MACFPYLARVMNLNYTKNEKKKQLYTKILDIWQIEYKYSTVNPADLSHDGAIDLHSSRMITGT